LISAFAGPHNGPLLLSGGSVSALGTTTGSFSASKKKEAGKLTLTSVIPQSGSTFILGEQYTFNKNKVSYVFTQSLGGSTAVGIGSGTAKIRKNKITYSLVFTALGQTIPVQGTMKIAKNNHLTITESIFVPGGPLLLNYQLGGKKKK